MPEFPGVELYPTIELLDRLHPLVRRWVEVVVVVVDDLVVPRGDEAVERVRDLLLLCGVTGPLALFAVAYEVAHHGRSTPWEGWRLVAPASFAVVAAVSAVASVVAAARGYGVVPRRWLVAALVPWAVLAAASAALLVLTL